MSTRICSFLVVGMMSISSIAGPVPEASREQAVYAVRNWQDLRRVYCEFHGEVDGVVAGAFVDKVSQLLDEQWQTVSLLNQMIKANKQFNEFILANLNDAVPADRAVRIKKHAERSCPAGASNFCREVAVRLR